MSAIPIRAFCDDTASVLQRVSQGEQLTVTNDGNPVARLVPLRRGRPLSATELIARRRNLPPFDLDEFRRDMDEVLDPSL